MNFLLARARGVAVIVAVASLLVGCAVVKIKNDGTDTVAHSGGEEAGAELANRACRKVRAARAEIISTVPEDDSKPAGEGRSVTTFRCIY